MFKKAAYIAIPFIAVLAAWAASLLPLSSMPPCAFFALTGYYCTGCGGTRAVASLFHGDLTEALRCNAFVVLLIPFALYFYTAGFFCIVLNKKKLPVPKKPANWLWALLGAAVLFMVVRNIDIFPFTVLKP